MTLSDLRKARELTQKRVAEALHISQDEVSRIEARSDFLLSTLGAYVEALGGKLRLVAEFPHRRPVIISGLESLGPQQTPRRRGRKAGQKRAHQDLILSWSHRPACGRSGRGESGRHPPSPCLRGEGAGVRGGAIFRRIS